MKTIKQQNMDLDLRRFGHNLYTEALNSGSGEGEEFDLNTIINDYIIQSAPPSAQSSIILPDLWCHNENNSFEELSIEAIIEAIVEGNHISIIPFYKESPQTDSTNYYLKSEDPGVIPIAGRSIQRIESEVINGETYYYIGNGVM